MVDSSLEVWRREGSRNREGKEKEEEGEKEGKVSFDPSFLSLHHSSSSSTHRGSEMKL